MLTHEDDTDTTVAGSDVGVDTRPALRKAASRTSNWWIALLLVFPWLAIVALVLSPVVAVLVVAGLGFTLARYVVTGNWRALRHVATGVGLVAVGYWAARGLVHAGAPTVFGWTGGVRARADVYEATGEKGRAFLALAGGFAVWATTFLVVAVGSLSVGYVLVRPYRTRLAPGVVLGLCAVMGAVFGLVG